MKNFTRIILSISAAAFVIFFTACGPKDIRGFYGTNMSVQEDIATAFAYAAETIKETDEVVKVVFNPKSDAGVTKYAGKMQVYVYEENDDSLRVCEFPLVKREAGFDYGTVAMYDIKTCKRGTGVKFTEIDFSNMAKYIDDAAEIVIAASDDEDPLFFSGVGDYIMTFNKDPKTYEHKFSIESKDTAASTRNMDRYYDFEFEVKNGELISKDIK